MKYIQGICFSNHDIDKNNKIWYNANLNYFITSIMGMEISIKTVRVLALTGSLLGAGTGLMAADAQHDTEQTRSITALREQVRNLTDLTDSGITSIINENPDAGGVVDSGDAGQINKKPLIVSKKTVNNRLTVIDTQTLESELRTLESVRDKEGRIERPLLGFRDESVAELEERKKAEAAE